jgi:signal transduction histidine kinase
VKAPFDETVSALQLRQSVVEIVRGAIGADRPAVVLLWLWDPSWKVYVLNRHASGRKEPVPPVALRRRIAARKNEGGNDFDPAAWEMALAFQPEIRAWAENEGTTEEEFFPVWRVEDEKKVPIAFVQVLSREPLDPHSRNAVLEQLIGVGATIIRSRGERQLKALTGLLQFEHGDDTEGAQERWLTAAALTLADVTRARAAFVFRPGVGTSWESLVAVEGPKTKLDVTLVASGSSLIAEAAQQRKTWRLYDVGNPARRIAVTGSDRWDENLAEAIDREVLHEESFSWLATPVVVEGETVAVLVFVNKRPEFHLAEAFTPTDEEVVAAVARLLARIIPTFRLYEAVDAAARFGIPRALDDLNHRAAAFGRMVRVLPQIEAASVIARGRPHEKLTSRMLGGEAWFEAAEEITADTDGRPVSGGGISIVRPIPHLPANDAYAAFLVRSRLTVFDRQILAVFANELSHALRADAMIQDAEDTEQQLRHAFSAPLMLIVGQVHRAMQRLAVCEAESRDATADEQLRTALGAAESELAALKEMLTNKRYLLADIRPEMLRTKPTALADVLRDVALAVEEPAARKNIHVSIDARERGNAVIDRDLIYHALYNVVENAIKYGTPDTTVSITVQRQGDRLRVDVENLGSFIASEDREAIFHAFTRGKQSLTRPVAGTGLGLALAMKAVGAHGGTITSESDLVAGAGGDQPRTRITILLPASDEQGAEIAVTASDVRTVHHLDDEPFHVSWICEALRDDVFMRYRTWRVGEVAAGVDKRFSVERGGESFDVAHRIYPTTDAFRRELRNIRPGDVVILDVMTIGPGGAPVPQGLETYSEAVAAVGAESVFFLTAFSPDLVTAKVRVPPANVMTKPIDARMFLLRMSRALRIEP